MTTSATSVQDQAPATRSNGWSSLDWAQFSVFLLLHVACLGALAVGWNVKVLALATSVCLLQGFGITAFYHRYFAHRAFKTTRRFQFVAAVLGNLAMQRDPLWWASQHRRHHLHSDQASDAHSPRHAGLLWSHTLWFLARENCATDERLIRDFGKFPELRWLNRHPFVVPLALALVMYATGAALGSCAPTLGVSGPQLLLWGWLIPTLVTSHVTYCVNSLGHAFGARSFPTGDDSRNSFLLALLTLGEGWHNNHHHYPGSARHGFRWWQVDATYGLLRLLACTRLIWDLRPVPVMFDVPS